jgi:diguanylate cyclase (GGDEF)-like protein
MAGGGAGTILAVQDLTRRKELEEALRSSHEEFRNVVAQAHTGIVIVDQEGRVLFSNVAAQRLLNREGENLQGSVLGIPLVDGEVTEVDIRRPNAEVGVAELGVTVTEWDQQPAYLAIFYDITERKRAEEAVYNMAYHDQLTGLANRRSLKERLEGAIRRAGRTGSGAGVLLLDVDRFKEINDSLGHEAGDELIQAVGHYLPKLVRGGDTVARLSGDELAVLLEGLKDETELTELAEQIRKDLGQAFPIAGREVSPSFSIGYSLYPDTGEEAETLLRQADTAMYVAKDSGGNAIQGYQPEFGERALQLLDLDHSLNQAHANGEFVPFYQPQVDLRDDSLVGVEALLRWRSPERGLVSPAEFIPRLEETGLIVEVGEWLMATTWTDLAWLRGQLDGGSLSMSLNLSARQLEDPELVERLRGALGSAAIDPTCLTVEITETELVQQVEDARSALSRINAEGVQVALDDFGTGYSSLTYLRRFPVQEVKIDKSFVQDLPDEQEDAELVKAIIAMAHSFNKRVLAEGVETREQADFLRKQGCDRAQGFYFGRPVPVDDLPNERGKRGAG